MKICPYKITLNLKKRLRFDFFQYRPYIGDCPNCSKDPKWCSTLLCWEQEDDFWTYCTICRGADFASRLLLVDPPPHVSMTLYRMWMLYLTMVSRTRQLPDIMPKDLLQPLGIPKDLRHPVHTHWLQQILAVDNARDVCHFLHKNNIRYVCDMPRNYRPALALFFPIHGPLPGMLHGFEIHHPVGKFTIKLQGTEHADGYFHLWTAVETSHLRYRSLSEAFTECPYHILAGQTMPNIIVPFRAPPEPSEDLPATCTTRISQ
jgi:hypothetical protein